MEVELSGLQASSFQTAIPEVKRDKAAKVAPLFKTGNKISLWNFWPQDVVMAYMPLIGT